MKGIDAIREALRVSADCFYTVPGYPITNLAAEINAEMVINEKVGLEYALGDSLAGRRAAMILKNVGLNACADTLVQATTQGLRAGVTIVAGDDIDAVASQNSQDSRYFGELAQVPVLEPGRESCFSSVEEAFEVSEEFSRIAILRLTPPLLEAEILPDEAVRRNRSGTLADPGLTMNGRVTAAQQIYRSMFAWSRRSPLNRFAGGDAGVGAAPGKSRIVTVHPPPADVSAFADVHEFGRPYVREHRFLKPPVQAPRPERMEDRGYYRTFCRECPFRPVMEILQERRMQVIADAGCSLLAQNPPYCIAIASYGLGSAIGVAARSTGIALIGDYAILHSGICGLIDVYEKQIPLLCIVLKNKCMGMTGGQLSYDPCRYLAWASPTVCPAGDRTALEEALVPPDEPRTIIIEGNCPESVQHEKVAC